MPFYTWLLIASFGLLTALALFALRWAIAHGEFRNLSRTALMIFDEEEPVGKQTDFFPGRSDVNNSSPRERVP